MNVSREFRIKKLRAMLLAMEPSRVADRFSPDSLEIFEQAPETFDCPVDDGSWKSFKAGDFWGARNQWAWFRARATVPASWKDRYVEIRVVNERRYLETIELGPMMAAGPEGQLFVDGERIGALDAYHDAVRVPMQAGETYDIRASLFAARVDCRHILKSFELCCIDPDTEALYQDLRVLLDVIEEISEENRASQTLLPIAETAFARLDLREVRRWPGPDEENRDPHGEAFYASVPSARQYLREAIAALPDQDVPTIIAVGHAHIDLAWLWPMRCTKHKDANTFVTQTRLLDEHPDWLFHQSSTQA